MAKRIIQNIILLLIFSHSGGYANSLNYMVDSLSRNNYQNQTDDLIERIKSDILILNIDSNRIKLQQTLKICLLNDDGRGEADIYSLLGDYYSQLSLNDSAINYYKKALQIGAAVDYKQYFPILTNNIAIINWNSGDYNQALENALMLKDYYEKENTFDDKEYVVNLLGIIYMRLHDYQNAHEYLQFARKIAERKTNFGLLGVIYTNIGGLYLSQEKLVEALEYSEKGVKLEEENKLYLNAGRSFESIAKIYLALNNPIKAEKYLAKAVDFNRSTSDNIGFSRTYATFGRLFNYLKEFNKAIEYLKKAEGYAIKTDSKDYYMNICEQFFIAYQNTNNYQKALYYQTKYLFLYKQIYSIQDFAGRMKLESDLREEKQKNELNNYKIEKQRAILLLLVVVIALSLVISVLFIVLYNRTNKSKNSLIAMNLEINYQKDNLQRINIELEDARRNAENANELKAHFLKNISHEIRTPLNGIVGLSELMVKENNPSMASLNYLKLIKESSSRLTYSIDNIVELAHITTNQIKPQISVFDPKDLIEEVYQSYIPLVDSSENKVSFKCLYEANSEKKVLSDKDLLKRILVQLLDNALKFTPEGHVTIGCDNENQNLRFFIRDTGVGISESSQKLIFESFSQEQNSLTREYEGMGIGLTIAKKLSEYLGADLRFESKKNQGTTFYLCIRNSSC